MEFQRSSITTDASAIGPRQLQRGEELGSAWHGALPGFRGHVSVAPSSNSSYPLVARPTHVATFVTNALDKLYEEYVFTGF